MLRYFFLLWLISAVLFAVYNLRGSLGMLIIYLLLVPYSSFRFSFVTIEFNYFILAVFIIFLFRVILLKKESFDLTILKPFLIFSVFILSGSFFAHGVELPKQLSALRSFSIGNFLIPVMLWQICKEKPDVDFFIRIVFFCLTIMCIYGIYCGITGQNTYISSLSNLFNKRDISEMFSQLERAGMLGKVQSTTSHPMLWSIILCLGLFASYVLFENKNDPRFHILIPLMLVNLLICNVRSGIVAFILAIAFLFTHFSLRLRVFGLSIIVFIMILSFDISIFGKYQRYVDSIIYFNDSTKSYGGSSLDMRLQQFNGAVALWQNGGLFFGNGFGWCGYYYSKYGDHPVLLAFESILYVMIIENGILGIILYIFLFFSCFRINYQVYKKAKIPQNIEYWVIISYIIAYIIFILVTGIFGLNLFFIFLILMFLNVLLKNQNSISYALE